MKNEFKIDVKRFYFPGKLESVCPTCGASWQLDGKDRYLSYPTVNKVEEYTAYCDECYTEWAVHYRLNVTIEQC